ncbi:MAG: hypothetical protein M3O35_01470 [Acidobacteriota bacterium]|nr:hypothetical protein [Acidobacteriota bacterium]
MAKPKTFDHYIIALGPGLNRGAGMLRNIMPLFVLGIAKLTLASVFLWYTVALLCELGKLHPWMVWADVLGLIVLVGFCVVVFIVQFTADWGRPVAPIRGYGIRPFLLLVLIPIIIVAVTGQWNQNPCLFDDSDILKLTVTQTRYIFKKVLGEG